MKFYSTAYPCHSFPSGGINPPLPESYQEFDEYMKQKQQKEEERYDRDNFFRFFEESYGQRESPLDPEWEDVRDPEYPFSVFGMKRSSSQEDMKKAYHKAVRKTHPDKTGESSEEEFREVQEAYEFYELYHL
jgi:DnaJ-domain-containing protein 1